ncbi:elongation of very long chain fatty acids protein AAEL008004-like [Varroa jacobsoni]|uniref:elongation of very long chain fatty acids protein AAEL008004-like n=1 Tax=Varroa jacobsoni TaxID=62625 RepID=UPI000BF7509C|nr:elongation of very long chain fatty acids protein AAEL008004-like [Varroa jacobsoni]XP_022698521.1 elongation of very long chain fatty acids protein AAEL008004-like [Varroa jacobsoni]XP_022698522.1 elongation of very long chain fatty acids protein AAEL008004-like [Varroa jacobsoni]XP_022698523.1 elongation of very long chain fatty acids protein AAEL008004-like [Varroa jacobsoni]XP_022698524.1 elongation of very long chain fatty acids protein AAEL008004-like [Varroa jacobsoni]XP_022698525.1 
MDFEVMVKWLHEARDVYNKTLSGGDPRTSSWPLMDSPWPTLGICLFYAYFVKVVGPRLMKDREPMNIRWLMVTYNFFMVLVSALIFGLLGVYGWFGSYNWYCQPVDYSDTKEAILMTHLAWWYFVSKFIEFTDTIFFVLRKKFSHISTLHVIHHGMMPMSVWWGVKFTPGGHSTFFAFVNSLVHVLMYFYYGLAAIGPHMHKYLWWKQYMTSFQMVQFIAIFVHSFQLLFRPDCDYPRGFMWWIGFHAIMFWFLFADFYKNAYLTKGPCSNSISSTAVSLREVKNGKSNGNGTKYVFNHINGSTDYKNIFVNGYCHPGVLHDADVEVTENHRQNEAKERMTPADDQIRTFVRVREHDNGTAFVSQHTNGLEQNGLAAASNGPRTRSRIKKTD